MKIATVVSGGIEKPVVLDEGKAIDVQLVSDVLSDLEKGEYPVAYGINEMIEQWDEIPKMLKKAKKVFGGNFYNLFSVKRPRFGVPISRASKIICLGKNYAEHAKETGAEIPDEPILFGKFSDCAVPHKFPVKYPSYATRIDPEPELAVVIGKECKNVSVKKGLDCVFGYTIANDITERNLEYADMKAGHPWFRSKNFNGSMPIGPYIVTKEEVKDPHNLTIELYVNGKLRQKGNTKDMIFKINYLISYISKYLTLYPGDVISTGTISGIAPIEKGDTVVCKISKIGSLENKII
ncbi:MAG: fumarylacetoacetate hydrolase family protein [Caldisericaceae bacterium]|jgi:2-keto-4-pentenoate hydratase/2-oxohepta-3-ene-1,7-dioic acid hydratase in catechol pathway|nr:fumarylacetoacetate hydrolase family protein [Caldisericaceae bacterium]